MVRTALTAEPSLAEMRKKIEEATVFIRVVAGRGEMQGSGFVVQASGDQVLVATNDHVVNPDHGHPRGMADSRRQRESLPITVIFRSGGGPGVEEALPGTVVASEGEGTNDLALIRVRGLRHVPQPVKIGGGTLPELTTPLQIYGYPFGTIMSEVTGSRENPTITVNGSSVSGTRKDQFGRVSLIQINGGLESGNSGGPVVEKRTGELVGVAVAKIDGSSTVCFAIPASELQRLLERPMDTVAAEVQGAKQNPLVAPLPVKRGPENPFAVLGPLIDPLKQPAKGCERQRDGGVLTIQVPAGVKLLSPQLDAKSSPMCVADIQGDFVAVVKIGGNMVPGVDPPRYKGKDNLPGTYQGAGLILWQDPKNYVRLERGVQSTRGRVSLTSEALLEIVKGGKNIAYEYPPVLDQPLYLRMQRIDGAFTFLFGPNGKQWVTHQKLAVTFPNKLQVGLVASNMSKQPLAARFEEFELITDRKMLAERMKGQP
jgi:S1-C subfamily serine protease